MSNLKERLRSYWLISLLISKVTKTFGTEYSYCKNGMNLSLTHLTMWPQLNRVTILQNSLELVLFQQITSLSLLILLNGNFSSQILVISWMRMREENSSNTWKQSRPLYETISMLIFFKLAKMPCFIHSANSLTQLSLHLYTHLMGSKLLGNNV